MGPNMPVSSSMVVFEPSAAVKCNSAIQNSLAASAPSSSGHYNNNSNQFLTTINKLARLGTVEYEESPPEFRNNINETLKTKYIVLHTPTTANNSTNNQQSNQNNPPNSNNNINNKLCKFILILHFLIITTMFLYWSNKKRPSLYLSTEFCDSLKQIYFELHTHICNAIAKQKKTWSKMENSSPVLFLYPQVHTFMQTCSFI